MISLHKSVIELTQIESLFNAASEAYRSALTAVRDNIVEVEPAGAAAHRARLETILRSLDQLRDRDSILESASVLKVELHGYRTDAQRRLDALNQQLASTVAALQQLIESLAGRSDGHQERLHTELGRLKTLMRVDDLKTLRAGLSEAICGISDCIEQIQRQNQLVVALLRDEIRTLHSRVETVEHAATVDPVTGLMNRGKIEAVIQQQVASGLAFCMIFVRVENFKTLQRQNGRRITDQLTVAASRRLAAIVGNRGSAGHWSDDELIAIVNIPKNEAVRICRDLPGQLRGPHQCTREGQPAHLLLQVSAGVVEARPGERAERLLDRVDTIMRSLAGG